MGFRSGVSIVIRGICGGGVREGEGGRVVGKGGSMGRIGSRSGVGWEGFGSR